MKKLILFFLSIAFLITIITGCSTNDDLNHLKDGKDNSDVLRVGMDLKYYPFTGTNEKGEPAGVEVDIARALGAHLGREVSIINTEFSMLIPALQSNDIDVIIGSMGITEEREKAVDFSKPYLYYKMVALMNREYATEKGITDKTPVEEFFSIEDTRFVGLTGSISVSIPEFYGHQVTNVTTSAAAEREIANDNADVLVGAYMLFGMHATNPETTVMYQNPIEVSDTGMAVKKGNTRLLDDINGFIDQMESSGLNNELRKKWDVEIGRKHFDETIRLDYYLKK